ncbi:MULTISPECIES: hypothetical protein [unclassified Clostridium]|uniref:hypothetical protein n=1 Tax=Clostridium TaxID=1485 RepID=UPI001C8C7C20|nr:MULTISPECIES: hypothetical protein [unclassified Clostridium]MBX9138514.1 hypothetical protein [Clostridium sp. K12(2020)]MBX9145261.1 hypothetical protein [Clostridium sp. K13]MDU2288828.1 hypothetical protein [Clostridium celatum]MDU4325058.1 hypothetical protein [Clostridium celatum]
MKKYKKYMKLVLFTTIITLGLSCFNKLVLAYSPEEGKKIEAFIEKNNDLITSEEKENLNEIISKLNKYIVLSQEEREYIQECELNVIRKKLGDAQFEEYKKLIEKRSSGAEFQQPERFRLYELEKMLR